MLHQFNATQVSMKIESTALPEHSLLSGETAHYVDSYQGIFLDVDNRVEVLSATKAFFNTAPSWVDHLFTLRNKIVGVLGLKTSSKDQNRSEILNNFQGRIGEKIGFFQVFDSAENELVLGENDRHLDFRVSFILTEKSKGEKQLTISTIVHFHNLMGKLYFLPVKPFHKVIVRSMLKGILKELSEPKK